MQDSQFNCFIKKIAGYIPSDIKNAAGLRKYFSNTAWLFSEKILRLMLGILIVMWVARYLGPSRFGLLNYAVSFAGLFTAVASLGIDNVLVRELTRNPQEQDLLLGSSFILKLCGSFCAICSLVTACLIIGNPRDIQFLIIIAAFSLLIHPFIIFEFFFRSTVSSHYYAWAMMIALAIGAILRILFILYEFSLPYFAMVPGIELAVVGFTQFLFYKKLNRSVMHWRANIKTMRRLLNDSWPLLFSGAMVSIYMRIDQVMIQNMLGSEAVGYYSAAVRISEAWYFIPVVICQSVLPSAVSTKDFDNHLYERRFQHLFNLMAAISLLVAIPLSLVASLLIPFLYGIQYAPAISVFQIHIWAGIFVSLGVAGSNWLLVENLQKYYLFNVFFGALINISTNIVLIRLFSINGAALATILSYCVSSYLVLFLFGKTRPCFFKITRSFLIHKLILQGN